MFGTLQFGSLHERRIRRQQLRKQLQTLNVLLSEELRIINSYKELVSLRTAVMNGEASKTSRLAETRQVLQRAVQEILQNRVNHSLSELLLPLNGTDPSKCHAVHLLPDSHRSMFAPRVFGFPAKMAKDQFESYTAAPGHPWTDGGDEDPEANDDVDEYGNMKMAPSTAGPDATTTDTVMRDRPSSNNTKVNMQQVKEDQREDYVPVTQLKRYNVDEDEYTPTIRILRVPRKGLVFELVMPKDPPQEAPTKTHIVTEPYSFAGLPYQRVSLDAPLQNLPHERLSLVGLIDAVRAQLEGTAPTNPGNLPAILSSATPPAQARLTLDMTSVVWDSELSRIVSEARARSPATTWAELEGLSTIEEAVVLALRLDGLIVQPTTGTASRLRELVTGSTYLPPRSRSPESSPPGVATDISRFLQAIRDDPLRDARIRRAERDHDRRRRADEQEEGRCLLQSRASDDEEEPTSDGGMGINGEDDASEDELDAPWIR